MDNPWSRQEPEPTSRATPKALYSETALGCTFSGTDSHWHHRQTEPAINRPGFYPKLVISKVSPEQAHQPGDTVRTAVHREWCVLHRCAAHIAPAAQLYICSDAGCTAVRVDSSGVYTCMEGVISPVQLYGLYGTVCTRVYTSYIVLVKGRA